MYDYWISYYQDNKESQNYQFDYSFYCFKYHFVYNNIWRFPSIFKLIYSSGTSDVSPGLSIGISSLSVFSTSSTL